MTRTTLPDADHERELMAAGWRLVSDVPRRRRSPEGGDYVPASAWRALCGDRRRDGVA